MRVLAVANQKGGAGKTATAAALAHLLAADGRRVLALDLDPQGSLSAALGGLDAPHSMADVLGGAVAGTASLADVAITVATGLDLAPADIALAGCELALVQRMGREMVLRRALATVRDRYDLAVIDTAPSLGLLVVNALAAADAVLIPARAEGADLRGVAMFLDTLDVIRAELNPGLEVLGIVATQYDPRLGHHRDALEVLDNTGHLLPVQIPRSIKMAEALTAAEPINTYAPGTPTATAYTRLAEIVETWLRRATATN